MKYFLIFLFALLAGCEKNESISIVGDNNGNPIFCFSSSNICKNKGVQVNIGITIYELDESGKRNKLMWSIYCNSKKSSDYIIDRVEYSTLPKGWVESEPAKKIIENKIYSINYRVFFYKSKGIYYYYGRDGIKSSFRVK